VAARRPAAKRAKPAAITIDGFDDYEPPVISAVKPAEPDRFPIFYIGEEEFTAPTRIPLRLALEAIRLSRRTGLADAAWWMVEQTVGVDTVDRLAESAATEDQVAAVFAQLRTLYMGQMEEMVTGGKH
jgi:hypothetical protein